MKEYKRKYPMFSLCGLNCGLCPHHQSESESRCPGCGGKDFCLKHPTCAVVTCNKNHDNVEYCFQCKSYPCPKYAVPSKVDSFISYLNVNHDFEKCKTLGIEKYIEELNKKIDILKKLLDEYNNGRLKSFYCNAVNLLELKELEEIMEYIKIYREENDTKTIIKELVLLLETKAKEKGITLKLRK